MPMLYARRAFYDIALVNDPYWFSPFLVVASAFGDEENLTTWMNMPIQFRTGTIGCYSNTGVECTVSCTQLVKPNVSCVILGGG